MIKKLTNLGAIMTCLIVLTSYTYSLNKPENQVYSMKSNLNNEMISTFDKKFSPMDTKKNIAYHATKNFVKTERPDTNITNKTFTYTLCQHEYGTCPNVCTVELVEGENIVMGSYIKVYFGEELLTEGYILEHVSKSIFILKDKEDAKNPLIRGSCIGPALEINIQSKQIWGC